MALDLARFKRWRATVPWTDQQIADALEQSANDMALGDHNEFMAKKRRRQAEYVLKGNLTNAILSIALGYLVKSCTLCSKKALYRQGTQGRCRDHRYITNEHVHAKRQRLNVQSREIQLAKKAKDYADLADDSLRALRATHKGRA